MTFKLIKEKVYSEINVRSLSNTKIYVFVFSLLKDEKKTDSFLLDENFGGFTPGELNRAKREIYKGKRNLDFLNVNKKNINNDSALRPE